MRPSRARVRGRLEQRGWGAKLGYPALVLDEIADAVCGHLFTSECLTGRWESLDDFEGDDYRRIPAPVELDDGSSVVASLYVLRR